MSRQREAELTFWHVAALSTAITIGTLAVANRLSNVGIGEPPVVVEGEQRTFSWSLGNIAYTVKGHGEPLVMIHGIYAGASSYEFRHVFDQLAREFRVYAIDLLGFGRSAHPAVSYRPAIYMQLIEDFVLRLRQPEYLDCRRLLASLAPYPAVLGKGFSSEPAGECACVPARQYSRGTSDLRLWQHAAG